jgi:hypothetical protein
MCTSPAPHRMARQTTVASAKVWVPANTVNWLVVPAHLRTVFSSLVGVAWNTYLSLTLHDSEDEE